MPKLPFDETQYVRVRGPVVDEAVIKRNGVEIKLDKPFLEKIANNMNTKLERTGDLGSGVIGHTRDGAPEHEQPQVAAKLANWSVEPFGDRAALFCDHFIPKEQRLVLNGAQVTVTAQEFLDKFPKRSPEIWLDQAEIYPLSFLGATAPERDLGTLRLSANGESDKFNLVSPGVLKMAKEDEDKKKAENDVSTESKSAKSTDAKLDELIGLIQQLIAAGGAGAPAGAPAPGGEGGHDAELEQLLAELEAGEKGGGKESEGAPAPDAPPEAPPAKEDEKVAKLQRELDGLTLKLQRTELTTKLSKAKEAGAVIDDANQTLFTDLLALPSDMQDRMIALLPKRPGAGDRTKLDKVLTLAREAGEVKRVTTDEDKAKVVKLAAEKKISYPEAAKQLGFSTQSEK